MKGFLMSLLLSTSMICINANSQPWTSNGVCDFTSGVQWNNGGSTPCACTWWSVVGTDTILNCAFGDCGQSDLLECAYDCNGHNGNPTDMVPRTCDATAIPICWYQGAGNTAGFDYCIGLGLSIDLIDFWGNSTPKYNEILWAVASQTDNDYFTISHSTNGLSYTEMGMLDGEGTTNDYKVYRFLHMSPKIGINYYKLKQTDFNGEFTEFPVIAINTKPYSGSNVFTSVYPNPSSGLFYINYTGKNFNTPINVSIFNTQGVKIRETTISKFNDSQAIAFDLKDLDDGYYHIRFFQPQINAELGGLVDETKKIMIGPFSVSFYTE